MVDKCRGPPENCIIFPPFSAVLVKISAFLIESYFQQPEVLFSFLWKQTKPNQVNQGPLISQSIFIKFTTKGQVIMASTEQSSLRILTLREKKEKQVRHRHQFIPHQRLCVSCKTLKPLFINLTGPKTFGLSDSTALF